VTDRQTDRQTEFSSQYRVCITCSAVKTGLTHFATPPLVITWGENVRNLSLICDHTRLWAALVCKVSEIYKLQRERFSPNWCRSLPSSENWEASKLLPKNGPRNFVSSSVTSFALPDCVEIWDAGALWVSEAGELWKYTSDQIKDGGLHCLQIFIFKSL